MMRFALAVGLVSLAAIAAVLSNRVSQRLRVPAPAIFLLVAAAVSDLFPALGSLSITSIQRVVSIALVIVLFNGGVHMGWRRLRPAAGAVAWIGIIGTLVTALAVAVLARLLFGFGWQLALLLGTALAPTDPAAVFSILGRREVAGRSGTILEGESGANDPVGIALMISLLAATGAGRGGVGHALGAGLLVFGLQMAVGAVAGVAGGYLLTLFTRRVALPSGSLYPIRVLAGALAIYSVATLAYGSGFLAVFIAGIMFGDARAPYKADIERFHASLASIGEIVAFTVLGLSVSLRALGHANGWLVGLALAVLLTVVIRPLLVGPLLLAVRLRPGERAFIALAGLKGAVPILLGTFILTAHLTGVRYVYEIIFVVVAFSVLVQGGLVPLAAHALRVPMKTVEPEPWALGMRLRHEPHGLHRYIVGRGSAADGRAIADLSLSEDVWISFVSRQGTLVPVGNSTVLRAGDEVVVLSDPERDGDPATLFTRPRQDGEPVG